MNHLSAPPLSDALLANLRETAVGVVEISPLHEPLREVVAELAGVRKPLDRLLLELNHPYRNWQLILPELKGFVLKHAPHYVRHPLGPRCFELVCDLHFQALGEAADDLLAYAVLEGVTANLEKYASLLSVDLLPRYVPVFDCLLGRLAELPDHHLILLAQSHHPVKRTVQRLLQTAGGGVLLDLEQVRRLALRSLEVCYRYWLAQRDPVEFADGEMAEIRPISHATLQQHLGALQALAAEPWGPATLERLVTLPAFLDMVRAYRQAAVAMGRREAGMSAAAEHFTESRRLRFLFHILETDGLTLIHEESLREINRSLIHLVRLLRRFSVLEEFFLKTFALLKANVVKYPDTALHCIEALGAEVFKRGNSRLVDVFLGQVVRFGFQYSDVQGVDVNWQPIFNPAHLTNLRVWLRMVELEPQWSSTLLSALIINLKLAGSCIRDTDLFQKEVTRLLNSGIEQVYNLVKQFTRQLPVYYQEIGAEGEVRDVSTALDELVRRQDRLIHFLRKQCHVQSTNLTVSMARAVLHYWRGGGREVLAPYVARPVLAELVPAGEYYDGVRAVTEALFAAWGLNDSEPLLEWTTPQLEERVLALPVGEALDRRRVFLMVRLFQLLHRKYFPTTEGLLPLLKVEAAAGTPGVAALLALYQDDQAGVATELERRLDLLLTALEGLKGIVLSSDDFPAQEAVYQKRHIAVDIPSVYGSYSERKFNALAATFRLESQARIALEQAVRELPEGFITRAAFFKVSRFLRLFQRALGVDGIFSRKLENYTEILRRSLELGTFTYRQYLDLFRGLSEGVRDLVYTYYVSHHRDTLSSVAPQVPARSLVPKYRNLLDHDTTITVERISEAVLRDLIAETCGLPALDSYLTRLQTLLAEQGQRLSESAELELLLTYDPGNLFCDIHAPRKRVNNLMHLGGKGYNLVQLAGLAAPVPPGVILTTEYHRCREVVRAYPPARDDFRAQLRQQLGSIERRSRRSYGSTNLPLLLSVRSGALMSMPGMMQTIHNVGINEEIVRAFITHTGNARFAWDCYRRFVQSFAMASGLGRGVFSDLMRAAKQRSGVSKKKLFSEAQMEELALAYLRAARANGVEVPDDPWEQLLGSVALVLDSWSSPKAMEYRRLLNISDRWGTAVAIQEMVFGNITEQAGTGVVFTAHPYRKHSRVMLWGDYTPGNQGEDIVGGLVATFAISREQCAYDGRDPANSLERCFPQVYQRLLNVSNQLIYRQRWNPQEIEFTFDGPQADNLYLLQTRDMVTAKNRKAVLLTAFQETPELAGKKLAQGIGVSGGALCGRAVFNEEQIEAWRARDPQAALILIRYDTVPDDIKEIAAADGLLTARGGQTSHAAIVAVRLEKTCVVGCESLVVKADMSRCSVNGREIRTGDPIGIDGHGGLVILGWHPVESNLVSDRGRHRPDSEEV